MVGVTVLVEMWTALGERMAAKPSGPRAAAASASSCCKVGKLHGSASSRYLRGPLRVSVKDEHLMTVFNEINGKGVSHLAETDHTDASDSETSEHLARQLIGHVNFPSCFSGWD